MNESGLPEEKKEEAAAPAAAVPAPAEGKKEEAAAPVAEAPVPAEAPPSKDDKKEAEVAGGDDQKKEKQDDKEKKEAAVPVADAAAAVGAPKIAIASAAGSKMATAAAVPKVTTAAAAPSAQSAAKAPATSPTATDAPAKITLSSELPTIERAYKIFETATKEGIKDKLAEAHKEVEKKFEELRSAVADSPELMQSIVLISDRLKGQLPFIDKLKRDDSSGMSDRIKSNEAFQSTLPTWDKYSKQPEVSQLEQSKKEALQKTFNEWRAAQEKWLISLYAIGATQDDPDQTKAAVDRLPSEDDLKKLPEKNCIDKGHMDLQLEEIRKNAMNSLKPGATNDQAMDAFAKQLDASGFKKVENPFAPLYYKVDRDSGEKFFVILGLNAGNLNVVNTIIEEKAHQGKIEWSNVPRSLRQDVENRCLGRWLDVYMDDKKTLLSECKPQTPGNWHEWLRNIGDKKDLLWIRKGTLKKQLIDGVVGKDPKRLREFWSDVSRNASPTELAAITKMLSSEQKEILREQYVDGLKEANEKIANVKAGVDKFTADLAAFKGQKSDKSSEVEKQLTTNKKAYDMLVSINVPKQAITLRELAKLVVSSPKLMSQKEQGELVQSNPEFLFYLSKEMAPEKFASFCQKLPSGAIGVLEQQRDGLQELFVDEVNRASRAKEEAEKVSPQQLAEVQEQREKTPQGPGAKAVTAVSGKMSIKEDANLKQATNDLSNAERNLGIFIGASGSLEKIESIVEAVKDKESKERIIKQVKEASALNSQVASELSQEGAAAAEENLRKQP